MIRWDGRWRGRSEYEWTPGAQVAASWNGNAVASPQEYTSSSSAGVAEARPCRWWWSKLHPRMFLERHRMFAKHPMSENPCRGDRPVAPTSLEHWKHLFGVCSPQRYSSRLDIGCLPDIRCLDNPLPTVVEYVSNCNNR